jgi:inosine/xanthosine triphosphatase
MMKRIAVASKNPVKIRAVKQGFEAMFPGQDIVCQGISAPSGVKDQPETDLEALQGALNRAQALTQLAPNADYRVGVEGGIEEQDGEMAAFAWVVVVSGDRIGKARTATFYLPPPVVELIRQGKELGEADDVVFGRSNSKQENGAVGLLTGDVIDRAGLYKQAVVLALAPIKNPELYK